MNNVKAVADCKVGKTGVGKISSKEHELLKLTLEAVYSHLQGCFDRVNSQEQVAPRFARTAIYSRLAHADIERLDMQEQELLQFAEKNGHGDCVCYRDSGVSGMSLDRPGMNSLITDIQNGEISTVIVDNLVRVARSNIAMAEWFVILRKYGIVFISVKDDFRFPNDYSLFGVLAV